MSRNPAFARRQMRYGDLSTCISRQARAEKTTFEKATDMSKRKKKNKGPKQQRRSKTFTLAAKGANFGATVCKFIVPVFGAAIGGALGGAFGGALGGILDTWKELLKD